MPLRVAKGALAYWAIVFAIGFVLGAGRVTLLAPRIGATAAVLVELPVMLTATWFAARRIVQGMAIRLLPEAAALGLLAFGLTLASELALGVLGFGMTPGEWLAALFKMPGVLGLAGQAIFAAMPALILKANRIAR